MAKMTRRMRRGGGAGMRGNNFLLPLHPAHLHPHHYKGGRKTKRRRRGRK